MKYDPKIWFQDISSRFRKWVFIIWYDQKGLLITHLKFCAVAAENSHPIYVGKLKVRLTSEGFQLSCESLQFNQGFPIQWTRVSPGFIHENRYVDYRFLVGQPRPKIELVWNQDHLRFHFFPFPSRARHNWPHIEFCAQYLQVCFGAKQWNNGNNTRVKWV